MVIGSDVGIIRLVRYQESSSFPISLRVLSYCPFCGKCIHSGNERHDCLPFKAASAPEKGHFVCKLSEGLNRTVLFNLVADNEHVAQGRVDYPETTHIGYCPYCSKGLT